MCTTTGAGTASMRGLAGSICGPPATSATLSDPATTGKRLRTTKAAGTPQLDPAPIPVPVPGGRCRACGAFSAGSVTGCCSGRTFSIAPVGEVIRHPPR